jgi:integrase
VKDSKTAAGVRRVPIHSFLLDHGIIRLLQARKSSGAVWLFNDLRPYTESGERSYYFVKNFSATQKKLGISDQVTFHSFRHNFRSKISTSQILDRHIDAVLGHETATSAGAVYQHRETYSISELRNIVQAFAPPLDLSFIKPALAEGKSLV